jgi:hypothetical protein
MSPDLLGRRETAPAAARRESGWEAEEMLDWEVAEIRCWEVEETVRVFMMSIVRFWRALGAPASRRPVSPKAQAVKNRGTVKGSRARRAEVTDPKENAKDLTGQRPVNAENRGVIEVRR